MSQTVVAVDVGAGNTKYLASQGGQVVASGQFPSIASLATAGSLSSFQTARGVADEVSATINGSVYKVSLSPNRGATGATRVAPGDDFQQSPQHLALLAAGLHAVGLKHIDMLVVGTPVHTFEKHREHLSTIQGRVDFGLGQHTINATMPLPQPFGSLLSVMSEGSPPSTRLNAQLVIDAGFYTIDVLRARGLTMETAYSFSLEAGMGKIYRRIADALALSIRKPIHDLDIIEFCHRANVPYVAYGKQILLGEFAKEIQAYVDSIALEIYGRAGQTENLSSICVTGGGGEFFKSAIKKMFGDIPVHLTHDPLMANVRGYLIAGQSAVTDQRTQK